MFGSGRVGSFKSQLRHLRIIARCGGRFNNPLNLGPVQETCGEIRKEILHFPKISSSIRRVVFWTAPVQETCGEIRKEIVHFSKNLKLVSQGRFLGHP